MKVSIFGVSILIQGISLLIVLQAPAPLLLLPKSLADIGLFVILENMLSTQFRNGY
jgi:hypothetical protein